ncbi:hypothetical protein GU926_01205 [Nibribacter ruber]|uniref:Proteinase inhibitor I42 chagasin domain-containing protein n=1 Tax=Nibribacter ruber TaxID=2698458 RepID=A0A6P1NQM3_9BACT|nr:hypothetical protein [Nibribacter ruber]QHL86136.1 hypothetical protein GU926_01205 [Nibribacter ruber]
MKSKLFLVGMALAAMALHACSETADLIEVVKPVPAIRTENFPVKPIKVDSTVVLRVYYQPSNGCGRFSRIDSTTTQPSSTTKVTNVQFFAAYPEEGQDVVCTAQAKESQYTLNYKAKTVGKHIFKFWKTDSEFVSDTVTVEAR